MSKALGWQQCSEENLSLGGDAGAHFKESKEAGHHSRGHGSLYFQQQQLYDKDQRGILTEPKRVDFRVDPSGKCGQGL